jgi:hypothetical protein
MLGAKFVIVSDEKIVEDLLVKRAKIYSDRPQIRSLFDPKSTHGSMEYLPLMGRNSKSQFAHSKCVLSNCSYRILVPSATIYSLLSDGSYEQSILRCHEF